MIPNVLMTDEQIQELLARLADTEQRLAATTERLAEAEEVLHAIYHGEVDGLVVNSRDGDRIFTLEGAEHPYRVMIEAMEEGAAILSVDGTILYCNRRFAAMLHASQAQMLGTPVARYLAPESQTHFAGLTSKCRRGRMRDEVVFLALEGTRVPVSLVCSVLPESERESLCIIATDLTTYKAVEATIRRQNEGLERRVKRARWNYKSNRALREEIAERKRVEEALRASEQRYRSLFNGMTEGFALHEIICNADGEPCDYRFLDINPAFERFTGLRREGCRRPIEKCHSAGR